MQGAAKLREFKWFDLKTYVLALPSTAPLDPEEFSRILSLRNEDQSYLSLEP